MPQRLKTSNTPVRRWPGGITFMPLMLFILAFCIFRPSPDISNFVIDQNAEISRNVRYASRDNNASEKEVIQDQGTPPVTPPEHPPEQRTQDKATNLPEQSNVEWWQKEKPLLRDWPYLERRNDIHPWLEKLNYSYGIEVGVQKGLLAKRTLSAWKSCKEYKLVDLWGSEENYKEPGVDTNAMKNSYLRETQRRVKGWTDKNITEFYVMRSTEAAKFFDDGHFDYVYIDARHDYCAVKEDIEYYWPKVRSGGILAGHDFIDAPSAMAILGPERNEDWSYCEDGTVEPRAVKGAVEDFAAKNNLEIVTTHEGFDTWLIQKPYEEQVLGAKK